MLAEAKGICMKRAIKATIIIVAAVVFIAAMSACRKENNEMTKKPEEFILGMDASCVPSLEASGVKYYDHAGNEKDVFEILSQNGINYIRVRVWNDPFTADGKGYGGGNCDVQNAAKIGKSTIF